MKTRKITLEMAYNGTVIIDSGLLGEEAVQLNFKTPNKDGNAFDKLLKSVKEGDRIEMVFKKAV